MVVVTRWSKTVLALLKATQISQLDLARGAFGTPRTKEDKLRQRVAIHRYVHGKLKPNAEELLALNHSAEKLIGVEGVGAILDAIAVLDGLLDVDDVSIVGAAFRVLGTLEGRGILVNDWDKRLLKQAKVLDKRSLPKLLAAILVATWQPLIDDIIAKTPIESISPRLSAALSSYGLSDLVASPPSFQGGIDDFLTAAREELKTPPTTSAERLAAEQRLLEAASLFCTTIAGPMRKSVAAALGGLTRTTKGPQG